jgi:hypothetical protein
MENPTTAEREISRDEIIELFGTNQYGWRDEEIDRVIAIGSDSTIARVIAIGSDSTIDRVIARGSDSTIDRVIARGSDSTIDRVIAMGSDSTIDRVIAICSDSTIDRVIARCSDSTIARVIAICSDSTIDRVIARCSDSTIARVIAIGSDSTIARVIARCSDSTIARVKKIQKLLSEIEPMDKPFTKLLNAIKAPGCKLEMSTLHECSTTHCEAGWLVTLHPQGKKLEKQFGWETAASIILKRSAPGKALPNFYAPNDLAMEFIEMRARKEQEA